jgi:hypothetical protein
MFKTYRIETPIIHHFESVSPVVIVTEAGDFAICSVLSQDFDAPLHCILYQSRKMDKAKNNDTIHDKEIPTIVSIFTEFRHYLDSADHPISVFMDHMNLKYFTTMEILNRTPVHSAHQLEGYDFIVFYPPLCANAKPDALPRHWVYHPKTQEGSAKENKNQPILSILKPNQLVNAQVQIVQVTAMK